MIMDVIPTKLTIRAHRMIETNLSDNDTKTDVFSNPVVWPNIMNTNIGMGNTDNNITVNPFSKNHVSTEKERRI
jgi:hypothetical protein